jgi:hypothetical protein
MQRSMHCTRSRWRRLSTFNEPFHAGTVHAGTGHESFGSPLARCRASRKMTQRNAPAGTHSHWRTRFGDHHGRAPT